MPIYTFNKTQLSVQISKNFIVADIWANPKLTEIKFDSNLAVVLEKLYSHFKIKPRLRNRYNGQSGNRYEPTSSAGYRISTDGGAKGSQHKFGKALDIEIPGVPALKIAQYLETLPEVGGIGYYYYPGQLKRETHVHFDTRSSTGGRKARWGWKGSYSGNGRLPGWGGIPCVFKRGSQSAGVELIQTFLVGLGYKISADGEYGNATITALKDYQKKNGLKADGVFGSDTNKVARVFDWDIS